MTICRFLELSSEIEYNLIRIEGEFLRVKALRIPLEISETISGFYLNNDDKSSPEIVLSGLTEGHVWFNDQDDLTLFDEDESFMDYWTDQFNPDCWIDPDNCRMVNNIEDLGLSGYCHNVLYMLLSQTGSGQRMIYINKRNGLVDINTKRVEFGYTSETNMHLDIVECSDSEVVDEIKWDEVKIQVMRKGFVQDIA